MNQKTKELIHSSFSKSNCLESTVSLEFFLEYSFSHLQKRKLLKNNVLQLYKFCRISRISGSVKLHIGDSWDKPEMHKCPRINVEMEPRMGDGKK